MGSQSLPRRPDPRAEIERLPTPLLKAVVAMVLFSLALVTYAKLSGMQPAAAPPPGVAVVEERMIQIIGSLDGGATVLDQDGQLVANLDPSKGGFIAGVYRALARERMLRKIEGNPPVRLVRFADGRLGLRDPSTGWRLELIAFGDTNRDAFASLLD